MQCSLVVGSLRCVRVSPGLCRFPGATSCRWQHSKAIYDDRNAKPIVFRGGLGIRNDKLLYGTVESKPKRVRSRPSSAERQDASPRRVALPAAAERKLPTSPGFRQLLESELAAQQTSERDLTRSEQQQAPLPGAPAAQLPPIPGLRRLVDPLDSRGLDMVKTVQELTRQRDHLQRTLNASRSAAKVAAEVEIPPMPPQGGAESSADLSSHHTSADQLQLQTEIEHLDKRLEKLRGQRRRQKQWLKDEVPTAQGAVLPPDGGKDRAELPLHGERPSFLPEPQEGSRQK